ncbi:MULTISPECIES: peptide ABC transporter substrate-binding protein, partial [Terrabacteria group]|uniref:peptide ABC transporter substrate-binding protein n=1 Tax=Bacillati TaxID=1783272 RepID=UPI001C6E91E5
MKTGFKKGLAILVTATTLVGCSGGKGGTALTTSEDFNYVYATDPITFDYTASQRGEDTKHLVNFVDGLVENDRYGNYVGALAEKIEHSADYKTWTFKLRKGVKWYTNEQEEYAETTAHDFVTGLQHAIDADSGSKFLVNRLIKNLAEYEQGKVPFNQVGVKALDDYTVQYELTKPVTYFNSLASYAILYPVNKKFLESKGEGCKLGAYKATKCSFGKTDPSSILYNGAYFLTNFTTKSKIEYTKNPNYWDKDHVYINKVNLIYDDGQDSHSVMNGFEKGNYVQGGISGAWDPSEQKSYKDKYAGKVTYGLPDTTTFNLAFNLNRKAYKYSNKTEEQKKNTQFALRNVNFRKAFRAAFDRVAYATQRTGSEDLAKKMIRNTMTKGDFVSVNKKTFAETVAANVKDKNQIRGDFNDGNDAFFNPKMVQKYIDAAKAEGVKFPVTLDLVNYDAAIFNAQAASMKASIEKNSNKQILINVHSEKNQNKYLAVTYDVNNAKDFDWDISTATGWSPDYLDPKSYLSVYSPNNGDMIKTAGINSKSNSSFYNDSDKVAAEAVKLSEYESLLEKADAISDDMNKRYEAYAKAEAWLTDNALEIP